MKDLIQANFLDVCERCKITPEEALENDSDAMYELVAEDRDDMYFGIGYVRGLADAMDMTALQLIDEVMT